MKFLIQKIDNEVRHDFAFTLIESIRFYEWLNKEYKMSYRFINTDSTDEFLNKLEFKSYQHDYVPIGSVEFVCAYLRYFYGTFPKPKNIPNELLPYEFTKRFVFNGTEKEIVGKKFVKSNSIIKIYTNVVDDEIEVPKDDYQISDVIANIDSEWRAFVYKRKLVGLENYGGDFTRFPNVSLIKDMISAYKSAPIAYTLDVGVDCSNDLGTFIIEVHDFFSCGLYGFADHAVLPFMFQRWFDEYTHKIISL